MTARIGCGIPGTDGLYAEQLAALCPNLAGRRDNHLFDGLVEMLAICWCIVETEQLLPTIVAIRRITSVFCNLLTHLQFFLPVSKDRFTVGNSASFYRTPGMFA